MHEHNQLVVLGEEEGHIMWPSVTRRTKSLSTDLCKPAFSVLN